jgi:hypothetical protein
MKLIADNDVFPGIWQLKPELSAYEFGTPPAEGLYTIRAAGDVYLFEIVWKTAEGQSFKAAFSGIPDGKQYPYEDQQVADALSMTRVDELTLDSETFKGGKRIAHALRELIEDGRVMRVTQSGRTPDGETYSNVSYYTRLG